MSQNPAENASGFDEIPALEAEIEQFKRELEESIEKAKDYRKREDPTTGVHFASEIFALSQDKLRLQVEIELREKKINRIRLGISEADMYAAGEPLL